jgi:NAD(P)-dependent dehydrogenase (short-subunit alcohol dehydrogenase family)
MDLNGKVAVVTGGASGIGRGVVVALAQSGADVVIGDVNVERMHATAAEVTELGRRAIAVRCDVTSDADVDALAQSALSSFGHIDIAMNNAGVSLMGPPERIPTEDWKSLFDVNLFGVIRGIRAFVPIFLAQGYGWLINTSSIDGLYAHSYDNIPYIGSKYAVMGITEGLYLHLRPKGIRVSVLCPGLVATNIGENVRLVGVDDPRWTNFPAHMLRPISPEEVGRTVVSALQEEKFLILTHPEDEAWVLNRGKDLEGFLKDYIPILYAGREPSGLPLPSAPA